MSLYAQLAEEKLRMMRVKAQGRKTTFSDVRRIEVYMRDDYMDVDICHGPSYTQMECTQVRLKAIIKYPGAHLHDLWVHPGKVIMTGNVVVEYFPEEEVIYIKGGD